MLSGPVNISDKIRFDFVSTFQWVRGPGLITPGQFVEV